jgi:[acyl-carrier-protein] S-malonyltransferase
MAMDRRINAAVFPGQGSQRTGMGRDFFEQITESRQTYEEAADVLGWDVAAVCFADDVRLHLTQYTQLCIVTTEIAMLRGLFARYGFSPTLFGGHSLGEFTALTASGALSFEAVLKIVQERGRLMHEAVQAGAGAMTAVIADELNPEVIGTLIDGLLVDVANANSNQQIVLSGETGAVAEAESRLQSALSDLPSLRFVRLNVSAPFHSRLMEPILAPFAKALRELGDGLDPAAASRVTSNYLGGFYSGCREEIIESLVLQINHTVRWKQNMACLASQADAIWEIGPGRPLREFFRTIGVACTSVTTPEAAERAFSVAA